MNFPVIDLFSGAGGMGLGVSNAGADLRLSVEIDATACQTMIQNPGLHSGKVLCEDVRNLSGDELRKLAGISKKDPFLLVGGPPCQPFSKASYWTDAGLDAKYRRARTSGVTLEKPSQILEAKPDDRRTLVHEYYRLIKESKPSGFLFENVPSILHPRSIGVFTDFKKGVEKLGYKTISLKVNGEEYGIAQRRQRIILIGFLDQVPTQPIKTHSSDLNDIGQGYAKLLTVGEALKPFRAKKYFEPEEVIAGRYAEHLREIPPGMNYKALTSWAGHSKPSFVAETRFWNFLLKLHPQQQSWTIAANPGPWTGPFHWESRRLRTIELAVLQGFPSNYSFAGSRRDRVKQIGNALPSNIAAACIKPLLEILNGSTKRIAI